MNRNLIALLVLLTCSCIVLLLHRHTSAVGPAKTVSPPATNLGEGILVMDVVKGSGLAGRETHIITDAKLIKIGDRYYIRGKGFIAKEREDDPQHKWFKGVTAVYALDTVTEFYELTPDQFAAYMGAFKNDE